MLNIFSWRSNHPSPMKTCVWKIPVWSFMNAGDSFPILSKNLGQDNPTDIAGNPAAMKRTLSPCTLKNTSPIAKKGGCFKPASIAGNPSGTLQKKVLMKILIPILPKNYYFFTLIRRHAERQKSALRHGSPMRDPMAGRPLRTRKRNGRGTRQKNLSHPEKGSKMMIRNQWAEGKECAAGKFKNSWFT